MHRPRFTGAATLAVAALVLSACADADNGVAPDTPADPQGANVPAHAQGSPPDRAALAAAVPGFGGIFLDDGAPTVYLTDTNSRPRMERALSAWLAQEGYAPGQLRVRRGEFSYPELLGWFEAASREVFAEGGVVLVDLHEPTNRVLIGVEDQGSAARVRAAAVRAGVPTEALSVEVREPIRMLQTLRDEFDQIVGGIQINFPRFLCTLGFPATQGGQMHFVTNSHCTNTQGGVENTPYWQPLESTNPVSIGTEVKDPTYSKELAGCPRGKVCRYSDASLALSTGARPFNLGEIAAATLGTGSLVTNGVYTITAERSHQVGQNCVVDGTQIHKVGRTTGHTMGIVDGSCITVGVLGSNIAQLAQVLVSGSNIIGSGDSGSPAFTLSGSNATLEGIAWGGSSTTLVYSPLPNVELELGDLGVTSNGGPGDPGDPGDPALDAAFSYSCGNTSSCSFDASASTGAITSYSWNFGDGGTASSVTATHQYSAPGAFTVTLTVGDGTDSDQATATIACNQRGPNLRCK